MKPEPGTILQDRYRIIRKLGDGGMGTVYEGEHLIIQRRVAIKILHGQFAEKPEIVERFHREARAATAIGHPNIIQVTDFGSLPDNSPFMVLEFLEGRDWSKDIEREGAQPLGKIAHIMTQVCRALSAAHAKRIVHRDLKPENIFLVERQGDANFAKVLDFGISKFQDGQGDDPGNPHRLTRTGAALGTPYYMSPEHCQGRKDLDHRADIYSLGVILFQTLTGQYPFDDETYPMLVLKICTQEPPEIAQWRPDTPAALVDLVRAMLAKDPNQRPQSCAEVEAALRPYVSDARPVQLVADAPDTASFQADGSVEDVAAVFQRTSPLGGAAHTPTRTSTPVVNPSQPAIASGKRAPIALILGAGVLLLVAAVGGVALGMNMFNSAGGDDDPDTPTVTVNDPPPVEPTEPTEPNPVEPPAGSIEVSATEQPVAPAPAEPPREHIVITTVPPEADLLVDGELVPNPYDVRLIVSDIQHTAVARMEGYEDREVHFRTGQGLGNITLTLRRSRTHHTVRPTVATPAQPPPIIHPSPVVRPPPPPVSRPRPTQPATTGDFFKP